VTRRSRALLALALSVLAATPVLAQGTKGPRAQSAEEKVLEQIQQLVRELRDLPSKSPGGVARVTDQKRIFEQLARINHAHAVRTLTGFIDNPDFAHLREELLRLLAAIRGHDEQIGRVMREHMAPGHPGRRIARDYLLAQARDRRLHEWLDALFAMGTLEDKFLALEAMGDISSAAVLDCAAALAKDKSWRPEPGGVVSCGTLALALSHAEGQAAACLLLLLSKDPRFGPADAAKLREATRLWRETDLRAYLNLADLSSQDPIKREEAAALLGAIGLESARAPLVRVAMNRKELPEVRAAAASALGGLRIARSDLAEQLEALANDQDPVVRAGARAGLAKLMVRRSAQAFVSMLDGPFKEEVKAALSGLARLPPDTDWKAWLATASFPQE
jgi:hypothetical protein